MSEQESIRRHSARRFAAGMEVCPSCLIHLSRQPHQCPACGFTGEDTMRMFPMGLPPLQEMLDAADIWSKVDHRKIQQRVATLRRRFPQIHWSFCSVRMDPAVNLRLFGFWMLNASPLGKEETPQQRAWTILMVFNDTTGQAALVTGYEAEPWIGDDQWERLLEEMTIPWSRGRRGPAIVRFLSASEEALRKAWKRVKRQLRYEGRHS